MILHFGVVKNSGLYSEAPWPGGVYHSRHIKQQSKNTFFLAYLPAWCLDGKLATTSSPALRLGKATIVSVWVQMRKKGDVPSMRMKMNVIAKTTTIIIATQYSRFCCHRL